jgi:ADP-ribosylglycohydrolase
VNSFPAQKRFEGYLVGQALGDALGFMVEGYPSQLCRKYVEERLRRGRIEGPRRGPFRFGQYSDDTQLARELMQSYAAREEFDPQDYARRIAAIFSERRIIGYRAGDNHPQGYTLLGWRYRHRRRSLLGAPG